jgi:hypothetical protein
MSDYTNTGYSPSGGGGCLMPLAVAVLLLFAALAMMGGDDQANGNTAFSGNEVLSRNQVNVLSDVYNTFYDCYGAYSCVTTTNTTSTTTTSTTNAPVNVEGERNVVTGGLRLCLDADGNGYTTNQACGAGYTEAQP